MRKTIYLLIHCATNTIVNARVSNQTKKDDLLVYKNLCKRRLKLDKTVLLLLSFFWNVKYLSDVFDDFSDRVRIGESTLQHIINKLNELEFLTDEPIRKN